MFGRGAMIIIAAVVYAAACIAFAGDNHTELDFKFDVDTLKPVVLAEAKDDVGVWMARSSVSYSPVIGEMDIRLIDGEIPVYDLCGDVVGYLFIIYLKRGPLPTYKEIRESTGAFKAIMRKPRMSDDEDSVSFFAREYPFMNNCAWAIYGVNKRLPVAITEWHMPPIFLYEPDAKIVAKTYNGGIDVKEPKIVVFGAGALAYEFEIDNNPLIIPLARSGGLAKESINKKSAFLESDFCKDCGFVYTNDDVYSYYNYIINRDSNYKLK